MKLLSLLVQCLTAFLTLFSLIILIFTFLCPGSWHFTISVRTSRNGVVANGYCPKYL